MRKIALSLMAAFIALSGLVGQAQAAATLLPNGQQCFQATTPTSGGLSGPLSTLGTITGGSGYVNGTYPNVPLTGGSGFGATATITVTSNAVSNVSITNPGTHFAAGDVLSAATANLGGSGSGFSVPVLTVSTTGTGLIGLLGTITGGAGGTAGTYPGVALTGGSGSGATANITVAGGAVTAVAILNPGLQYQVADILSAASGTIGSTTGFSVPVSSVTINQALAGGSVAFYVPNTMTFKQTWKNAAQTILNTNPVTLDANGCATIYGIGNYRQVLSDALGNVVWDQLTTDTSAQQNVFWAGLALGTGTPNAIQITDPGFNGTDGSIINFFPIASNSGSTTLSIASSGFTNIPIVKDTTGGPVALVGGEIIVSGPANVVSVVYSAGQSNFHLLNGVIASASGATAPLCGAAGLRITNNGGTPNTIISFSADQIVMQTNAGLTINRSTVSTTVNITLGTSTATAGGMDAEAPGTNNWIQVWAIDNGAAPAGLGSLSASAPTMPSGYTYKCRLGAMRVDGSGVLFRSLQQGSEAQYTLAPSSNTANLPVITSAFGTYWTAQSVSASVPPTATRISVQLAGEVTISGAGAGIVAHMSVAPDNNYNTSPTATPYPLCSMFFNGSNIALIEQMNSVCVFNLESTNVYTGQATTGGGTINTMVLSTLGWKDKVNAN